MYIYNAVTPVSGDYMQQTHARTNTDNLFLPDFCGIETVFSVVVVGQLLAFVLSLANPTENRLADLAMTSLFVQWVALSSAALLCVGRRWLQRLGNVGAGLVAWAVVLAVTAALNEGAWWLVEQHTLPVDVLEHVRLDFQLRNLAITAIVSAVALRHFYVLHQWRQRVESEARARFQALQSRIRPHFLFNSMNTIASLTRTRPQLAEQVVEDLADLFRVSLGDASVPSTLAREIELCREYLRIEQQRLGARLETAWRVDELPGDALLPALSLQPLLENAIYHGIEPSPDGGLVELDGGRENGLLRVRISNTLPPDTRPRERPGNRMAQDNVRERLTAYFGERARLESHAEATRYVVEVVLPYRHERTRGRAQ